MREILFRGKRIENGEWVEGFLYKRVVCRAGCYSLLVDAIEVCGKGNPLDIEYHTVEPSTVGQYTGLTDKNGKRIFHGDIVEGVDYDADNGFGVVSWNDGAFEVGNGSWSGTFHENYFGRDFEVIGNTHDNPELLEGGNDHA